MNYSTETIWDMCRQPLSQFIGRRVNDKFIIDDILQDVFIKIHSNIGTLTNKEKLSSWVYRITRNTIIDYYRRKKITTKISEDTLVSDGSIDSEPYIELEKGLVKMIEQLPEKYRDALLLTDYGGLTQREMSEKLDISLPGAKSRVQRARKMLKEMYLDCCHFEFDRNGTIIDYYPKNCQGCSSFSKRKKVSTADIV
jgi:RNA polymerase sigma-70 factor (ECF subfamily)